MPNTMSTFYSNGKLLLTGEYLVLDGAQALALPTSFGQSLSVAAADEPGIRWRSFDHDGSVWLEAHVTLNDIRHARPSTNPVGRLLDILRVADEMSPGVLEDTSALLVETRLTFPRHWGLGSSSTLLCNIARWFEIDPYALLEKTFGGSGYDIACGIHDSAILFRREYGHPIVVETNFLPPFRDNLYFVYLNQKQDSREAIAAYRAKAPSDLAVPIREVDRVTQRILDADSLSSFVQAIDDHEALLSSLLGMPTVRQRLFPDFPGGLKSLGGWGGDFILAASLEEPTAYFNRLGYATVVPYRAMIK